MSYVGVCGKPCGVDLGTTIPHGDRGVGWESAEHLFQQKNGDPFTHEASLTLCAWQLGVCWAYATAQERDWVAVRCRLFGHPV